MNVDRLVEQARELRPAATGEAAYQFLSEAPGLLAGLADAVERLEAERDEAIDAHDTLIDEQRPLLTEVSDLEARVAALEAERQAVIDAVNLYGDETLHHALDAIGFAPQVPSTGQETT